MMKQNDSRSMTAEPANRFQSSNVPEIAGRPCANCVAYGGEREPRRAVAIVIGEDGKRLALCQACLSTDYGSDATIIRRLDS